MESAWAIKTGQLLSFSEQELLDCAANGARTCNTGGNMQDSWNWLINGNTRRSPMHSASYPYTANSDASCLYNASRATNAVFASRVYVQATEAALLTAARTVPSIAVAIHASGRAFQFYSSGVLSDSSCLSTNLDHAVNVVGFGTDAATGFDYWLVRNSWSSRWGENGYVKIRRNFNNMCGIATQPTYITA
jgi:cathepsin L